MYMKIQLLLILLIIFSCRSLRSVNNGVLDSKSLKIQQEALYKVYKIDSIKNFYLIYAKRKDTLYKIVSQKAISENCISIRVNQKYPFILHSRLAERARGKIKILPGLVNCFSYAYDTVICFEGDSINDLHSAENVKGLCFLRDYRRF